MSENCVYCGKPVNPFDSSTWKLVTGWVGGPKRDSMRLREDTGKYAHNHCIQKLATGQAVDQPEITEAVQPKVTETDPAIEDLFN